MKHDQDEGEEEEEEKFVHVVENDYVLRLCPCGRRRNVGNKKCDCEYSDVKSFCSDAIKLEQEGNGVFEWCQPGVRKDSGALGAMYTPQVDCGDAVLSGVMASCTPVQSEYDKVTVKLHKQDKDVQECDAGDHDENGDVVQAEAPLTRVNRTHGSFEAAFEDGQLEVGAVYCLTLQLMAHPYCRSSPIVIGSEVAAPPVCSSHVAAPLRTGGGCLPVRRGTSVDTSKDSNIAVIVTIVVLSALAILACCGIAWWRRRSSKRSREDAASREEEDRSTSIIKKPLLSNGNGVSSNGDNSSSSKALLIHFSSDNADENKAAAALRDWMADIGVDVVDPSDERRLEEVSADQEGWTERLLSDDSCKILVVDSPTAAAAMSPSSKSNPDDPLFDLKLAAVRRLQSQTFVGNYRRLYVVNFLPSSDSSSPLKDLTSMRQIQLPEHLAALASALSGVERGTLSNSSAEKTLLECCRRLRPEQQQQQNGHHLPIV